MRMLLFAFWFAVQLSAGEIERVQLTGRSAHTVAATSDGSAWMLAEDRGGPFNFALFRLSPAGVLTKVVPETPRFGSPLDADASAVWLANDRGVDRVDLTTGELRAFDLGQNVRSIAPCAAPVSAPPLSSALWLVVRDDNHDGLLKMLPDGAIADSIPLAVFVRELQASADCGAWVTELSSDEALLRVAPSGAVTRIAMPFRPLHVQPVSDSLWVTSEDRRVARVAFDGTVLAMYSVRRPITRSAVDAAGNLWFADRQDGLSQHGRDGLLRRYELPQLPAAACVPSPESMPIDLTPDGVVVLLGEYEDDGAIFITPCDVEAPADFVYRISVGALRPYRTEDLRPPTRKRAVRK